MEWTPRFFGGSLHSLRGGSWGGEAGEPILGPGASVFSVSKSQKVANKYSWLLQHGAVFFSISQDQKHTASFWNPLDHGHHPVPPTGGALNTAAIMGCRRLWGVPRCLETGALNLHGFVRFLESPVTPLPSPCLWVTCLFSGLFAHGCLMVQCNWSSKSVHSLWAMVLTGWHRHDWISWFSDTRSIDAAHW